MNRPLEHLRMIDMGMARRGTEVDLLTESIGIDVGVIEGGSGVDFYARNSMSTMSTMERSGRLRTPVLLNVDVHFLE